ncbi:hypothetical protein PITCH_A1710003 [uncultured Desulfobacterium sp.]|uniref:Uncharacterized protein n=1 Tax=uncultured Desulfobacterium sp. TaxID=201089 RepID=A0A445MUG4_9BACT|nr:hypothetical protein PITCH_A1710003 [uncultured Desulfobacterium sp.]
MFNLFLVDNRLILLKIPDLGKKCFITKGVKLEPDNAILLNVVTRPDKENLQRP